MTRLSTILGNLIDLTPRESWRLARGRFPFLPKDPRWTANDLMNSVKHRHGIRFAELFLRQEAILTREIEWKPLDFEGANVVEIGCGPLAGYGPLAIFLGAESFCSAEPEWDPVLFQDTTIADRYFRILHADLTALYGPRMTFMAFYEALMDRIEVSSIGFEDAEYEIKPDIVLSQSCLEHVFPLEGTVRHLAKIQKPDTRFLHLVDFGNHQLSLSPFDGLYECPPEKYIADRGKAINMLRVSDVQHLFESNNIPAHVIHSRVIKESYNRPIHDWWHSRYDDAALYTQLAIIAGPAV